MSRRLIKGESGELYILIQENEYNECKKKEELIQRERQKRKEKKKRFRKRKMENKPKKVSPICYLAYSLFLVLRSEISKPRNYQPVYVTMHKKETFQNPRILILSWTWCEKLSSFEKLFITVQHAESA